jgi:dTDP-4-amino-4,6-dideoxygalactose transaminase
MNAPAVPLLDLAPQHAPLLPAIEKKLAEIARRAGFVLGPEVDAFEHEFGALCGAKHAIGVASGTDGLHLALRAFGVGPGDEVIIPAFTFIASASAVVMAGARPVFADIDPDSFNLPAAEVERRLTPRTKAVMPVHLYGRPADLDPILDLARRKGLSVLEDACQAHGARYGGRPVGALGRAGVFSFYPTKNLGGWGDGGLVATNDDAVAAQVRLLYNHGRRTTTEHLTVGYTARLDAIQAAVLRIKLPHLESWNAERVQRAGDLRRRLAGAPGIVLPPAQPEGGVWHLFIVRAPRREALKSHLQDRGVFAAPYYPVAVPFQPAFADHGHRAGDFPHAEQAAREALALPFFPGMTADQIDRVVDGIRSFPG